MKKSTAPISLAGSQLGDVRHVCAFFNSDDEEYRVLLPFIKEGFERGDKAVHVVNPNQRHDHLQRLTAAGIDPVFLVAPSSTTERICRVAAVSRGFVYVASTMGVTGVRAQVSDRAESLVARVRPLTELPLAVGLGVSTGAQAAEVAAYADGVIVGSAFVRRLIDAPDQAAGVAAVRELAVELAAGVRGAKAP